MDSWENILFGISLGAANRQTVVGRDEVNNYTIDTCYTVDCGWETAVWYDNYPMIIVARYPDEESAKQGHAAWVDTCTTNMPTHAFSVQTDCIESFMEE